MAALARPFAIVVAFATGGFVVASVLLWARSGFATPPYVFMRGPAGMFAFLIAVTTQVVSGYLLAVRRPDLPIGRLALAFAFVVGLALLANAYIAAAESGVGRPLDPAWVAWFTSWFAFSGASVTAITLGLVFPDGRLPGRRWEVVLLLAVAGAVLTSVAIALLPGRLVLFPGYANPVSLDPALAGAATVAAVVGIGLLAFGGASVSVTLLVRYRRADDLLRVQLRWYIASAIALAVGFIAFVLALATLPHDAPLGELVTVVFTATGGLPPIALLIAISRYRLYDIDTILSRAFVFGTLTAILAGVYTASIRLFNSLFTAVTGEASDAALVITTLVIAASFTPIKRRLEAFVERRFRSPEPAPVTPAVQLAAMAPAGDGSAIDSVLVERLAAAVVSSPAFAAALDARIGLPARPPTEAVGLDEPHPFGDRILEHG